MEIKVATTDRFRRTYRQCSHADQKIIDLAIDEWLESPKLYGTNFEKLSFTGDNIFSIRLSSGGRIIMAKFEGTYFLLHPEPNQHDKANNWAKNKKIKINSITGAIQIYSTNVEEYEEKINNKTSKKHQPYFFENYSDNELEILGVPKDWFEAIRKISNEDQLIEISEGLPEDTWNNLTLLFDEYCEKEILIAQIKNDISNKPQSFIEQIKIQPGIEIATNYKDLSDILKKDISLFRFYMHPTQKLFAFGNFSGPQKLTGSAGTGKTVVAMNRAKFLSENLKEEDNPVFFTTYTKALINNIKSIFEAEGISSDRIIVNTIHSFALTYGKEIDLFPKNLKILTTKYEIENFWKNFIKINPQYQSYDTLFLKKEYEEVLQRLFITSEVDYLSVLRKDRKESIRESVRKDLWKIFKDFEAYQDYQKKLTFNDLIFRLTKYLKDWPEYRPFSHIICDEIQDFNNNELRLLRHLVNEGPNDLFLCGDPFQNIYKKNLTFKDSGINIMGKRSNKLKVNYRTTEEIRKKAISIIENDSFTDFSGTSANFHGDISLISGREPEHFSFNSKNDLDEFLVKYIKESIGEIGLHELCICNRTERGLSKISETLTNSKISFIKLGDDLNNNIENATGKVILSTMHNLKGLEFKNLIVTDFDPKFEYKPKGYNNWTVEEKNNHIQSEHSLYYVVFSRAISNLIITNIKRNDNKY